MLSCIYDNISSCSTSIWLRGLLCGYIRTDQQTERRHAGAEPCVTWLLTVAGAMCVCVRACVRACVFTKCTSIWSPCDCRDAINAARPWELILCAAGTDGTACLYHYATGFKLLMTLFYERRRLFLKCATAMGQIISVHISLHCCNLVAMLSVSLAA